ncbi:MAG: DUF983 domain-containing protein [Rhodospirillaceae bacterium]|nr:MAG: DUF983 domain-containing protein [Rhodospirillaceae bacterium]
MSGRVAAPLISTALRGRCPRCGQGSLFAGYLRVAPKCPVCGLSLAGHDTGDGPAFFIMLPLCIMTAVLALLLDRLAAPPIWVHMIVWPIFIAAVVGFSLRPVKATMIGLQYRYRNVERDDTDSPSVS